MVKLNFKFSGQGLEFLRNYSSLAVPAVFVLVAVIIFIPAQLIGSKLKKQILSESINKRAKRVKSVSSGAVSREQWKIERDYQQVYSEDANRIWDLARQSSQRALLSYKIFPEPTVKSALIFDEFGRRFRGGIDDFIVRINARDCPTEEELNKSVEVSGFGSSRQGKGKSSGSRREREDIIRNELCYQRAKSASAYANPMNLSGYKFWADYRYYDVGMEDAIEDCWYWQLGYWIIEDVITTIETINYGSSSVFMSPVKRLISVNFGSGDGGRGSRGSDETDNRTDYVTSLDNGIIKPLTGRICDKDIDVVHFNVVVLVKAEAVLPFMSELCKAKQHTFKGFTGQEQSRVFKHNQIAILESSFVTVDREDTEHELYRYGEDAVVELSLVCEYIFCKKSYDEIKPDTVKELLAD